MDYNEFLYIILFLIKQRTKKDTHKKGSHISLILLSILNIFSLMKLTDLWNCLSKLELNALPQITFPTLLTTISLMQWFCSL